MSPTPERRFPRWAWWIVGLVALLCLAAIVALVAVLGSNVIGSVREPTVSPPLVTSPTETPTAEALPAGTPTQQAPTPTSPTETLPVEAPTALPTAGAPPAPAFDAQVSLAASAAELQVGHLLTVTVTIVNTGQVTFGSLRYQLLGEWEPHFTMVADAVVEHETDVPPNQSDTAAFILEARQAGTARLQANVTAKTRDEPPSIKPIVSEYTLELRVVP